MKTLIPLVKSDRLREINYYKSKDYTFRLGENKYIYLRKFKVVINRNKYSFEIRDNQSEQKFFITINDSCIYLTLIEIYDLLKQMCENVGTRRIVNILIGDRSKIAKIEYLGLEFEVMFFSNPIPKGKIILPESNVEISYEYLFLLIALIQDKSNYLWGLSNTVNHKYIDGILRLFACLVLTKKSTFLKKLGWDYNVLNNKYYFSESNLSSKPITIKDIKGNIIKIKYYLTQKQFESIIKTKKS